MRTMGLLRLTLLGNRGGQVDQGTYEPARTVSEKEVVSHRVKITTRARQTTRVKNMINSTFVQKTSFMFLCSEPPSQFTEKPLPETL